MNTMLKISLVYQIVLCAYPAYAMLTAQETQDAQVAQVLSLEQQTTLDYQLFNAVKKKNNKKVQSLIAQGAQPGSKKLTWPCLHVAARYGGKKMIPILVEKDPSQLATQTEFGNLPLQLAVAHLHVGVVKRLIAQNVDVNAIDCRGTSLQVATLLAPDSSDIKKQLKIINSLLQAGASKDTLNAAGKARLEALLLSEKMADSVVNAPSK